MLTQAPDALRPREALLAIWRRWIEYRGPQGGEGWSDESNGSHRNAAIDGERLECLLLPTFWTESFSLDDPRSLTMPEVARVLEQFSDVRREPGDDTVATVDGAQDLALADGAVRGITQALEHYLDRWSPEGQPHDFSAGDFGEFSYIEARARRERLATLADDRERLQERVRGFVDSYTMSTSVCLQGMHLLKQWEESGALRREWQARLQALRARLSERLTAAMLGLCRSFAVHTPEQAESWSAATELRWPDASDRARHARIVAVHRRLVGLGYRASFEDAGDVGSRPFEIGWSWGACLQPEGVHDEYSAVEREAGLATADATSRDVAVNEPYLYFTLNAIEGIVDLISQKIRAADLLNRQQTFLAARLTFLAELAVQYWSVMAELESAEAPDRWALEDMPWQTADGDVSEYWTLYLLSILLTTPEALDRLRDREVLGRYLGIAEELAQRARLTRKPVLLQEQKSEVDEGVDFRLEPVSGMEFDRKTKGWSPEEALNLRTLGRVPRDRGGAASAVVLPDPGLALHNPGRRIDIAFSTSFKAKWGEGEPPPCSLLTYDFAPRLLKVAAVLEREAADLGDRRRAHRLVDAIWTQHLLSRRVGATGGATTRPSYAWDDRRVVGRRSAVSDIEDPVVGSWYITERVVEALVVMIGAEEAYSPDARSLTDVVHELVPTLRALAVRASIDGRAREDALARLDEVEREIDADAGRAFGLLLDLSRTLSQDGAGR